MSDKMITKPIKNIERVVKLANERKSVVVNFSLNVSMRLPAAVVQNWQARQLQRFIELGKIKEYITMTKTESVVKLKKWLAIKTGDVILSRKTYKQRKVVRANGKGSICLERIDGNGTVCYGSCDRANFII